MTLEVSDKTEEMELRLRIPDWVVDGTPEVQIDGTKYDHKTRGGYIVIPADKVAEGTKITVKLPMEVTASNLPDGQTTYGFKYGPFVLIPPNKKHISSYYKYLHFLDYNKIYIPYFHLILKEKYD